MPLELADLSLVYLHNNTPHCKEHGAMNKVGKNGIWRCLRAEAYTCMAKPHMKEELELIKPKKSFDCRAGCRL